MEYGFSPTLFDAPEFTQIEDPYWKLILNTIDPTYIIRSQLRNWDRSVACDVISWNNDSYVGLKSSNANANVDLTKTFNLPSSGYYFIMVRTRFHPTDTGTVRLYDGTTPIEDYKTVTSTWEHSSHIMYPIRYFSSGNHTFKISVSKQAFVESFIIYKMDTYVSSSEKSAIDKYATEIDMLSAEFTQNSVNDTNILSTTIAMDGENFWNPNNDSLMFTDFCDHVTLILGPEMSLSKPMFGGYVLGPKPSDDGTVEIRSIDRMLDLMIQPIYHNFIIGGASLSNVTNTIPSIKLGSVYELGRYLGTVLEYPIETSTIPYEVGFALNFGNREHFNSVDVVGFEKEWDINYGDPKPSLKLLPGFNPGNAYIEFYNGDGWDAAIYNYLYFEFSSVGASSLNPLPINIEIDMYKAGETIDDIKTYTIAFTGESSVGNNIGSIKGKFDGSWEGVKFNLKAAFDKYAKSSEYHITRIEGVGTITDDMVQSRKCRALWFDNIITYKEISNAPKYTSTDVKSAMDELKQVCEETNHAAFIRPGVNRCDDKLVIIPIETSISEQVADEKVNIISVDNWEYNPMDAGICNQKHCTYNISDTKTGTAYYQDMDSMIRYKRIQQHEFLDDVSLKVDADKITRDFVLDNCRKKVTFSLTLDGCVLYDPSQYVLTSIDSKRLSGSHLIKAITQTLDIEEGRFESQLDLNGVSRKFRARQRLVSKLLADAGVKSANSIFGNMSARKYGGVANGAFI